MFDLFLFSPHPHGTAIQASPLGIYMFTRNPSAQPLNYGSPHTDSYLGLKISAELVSHFFLGFFASFILQLKILQCLKWKTGVDGQALFSPLTLAPKFWSLNLWWPCRYELYILSGQMSDIINKCFSLPWMLMSTLWLASQPRAQRNLDFEQCLAPCGSHFNELSRIFSQKIATQSHCFLRCYSFTITDCFFFLSLTLVVSLVTTLIH